MSIVAGGAEVVPTAPGALGACDPLCEDQLTAKSTASAITAEDPTATPVVFISDCPFWRSPFTTSVAPAL